MLSRDHRISLQALLITIVVVVSFALEGCSYYYYTVAERTGTDRVLDTPIGPMQFEFGPLLHCVVGKRYADMIGPEKSREMEADTTSAYFSFSIYIKDTTGSECKLAMDVDSIRVDLTAPNSSFDFVPLMVSNRKGFTRFGGALDIEPITIPRDYKQDFYLVFTIRVLDQTSGTLLMTKEIRLRIIYHRERYFIFDAPCT